MLWERDRGQRVLVVVVFAGPAGDASDLLERIGIDELRLDTPPAPRRAPDYATLAAVLTGGDPGDAAHGEALAVTVDEIVRTTQARHIYLPLGIGGHVDHLIVHQA